MNSLKRLLPTIAPKLPEIPTHFLKGAKLKELETKGYLVFRKCIPETHLNIMENEFINANLSSNNNYNYVRKSLLNKALGDSIPEFIKTTMNMINTETDIHVDTILEGYYWPTDIKNGTNFPWHQDHEPFYMNEKNYNYLNFYIIVRKEKAENANLALVPFDRLPEDIRNVVIKKGGTQYGNGSNMKDRIIALGKYNNDSFPGGIHIMDRHEFIMRCSMTGRVNPLPICFDNIMEMPHLEAGDMIIMRGDVIHRTGDTKCKRLALSIRCVLKEECVVDIDKLMRLSSIDNVRNKPINTHKAKVMLMNKQWIDMLSIMSASNISKLNVADNPEIWENGNKNQLTIFQHIKFYIYRIYYRYLLKQLSTNTGTFFYWSNALDRR
jgi:hypothetical protein